MKLLTVMECLGRGGTEQFLVSLLPALQERGFQTEILVMGPPLELRAELAARGVVVHVFDESRPRSFGQLPAVAARVAALVRRGGFDVVHGKLFFAALAVALSDPLTPGTPKVVSFHNLAYESHPPDTLPLRLRLWLERGLLTQSVDRFFALSPAVAEHYRVHQGIEPIEVIPNAVAGQLLERDRAALAAGVRARLGIPEDAVLASLVARLVPEKGHAVLLDALDQLPSGGGLHVLLAGQGPEGEALRARLAARAAGSRVPVHFLEGGLAHEDALALLAASDLALLPSRQEAFGLGAAEAMALGVPVLASAVGGLAWLIEHGRSGWLVPPAHPGKLGAALSLLAGDAALRARLGSGARGRIADHFTVDRVADQWAAAYREASTARERSGAIWARRRSSASRA